MRDRDFGPLVMSWLGLEHETSSSRSSSHAQVYSIRVANCFSTLNIFRIPGSLPVKRLILVLVYAHLTYYYIQDGDPRTPLAGWSGPQCFALEGIGLFAWKVMVLSCTYTCTARNTAVASRTFRPSNRRRYCSSWCKPSGR